MTMMRTAIVLVALLAPATAMAQATQDQMQMGTPEERAACRPDVRKHCSGIDFTKGETHLGCLKLNREKLSKACKDVLTKHGQ
ncbi:MAG: cysteine rich repeat-containing protein [Pseudomonadota bacterium]